MSLVDPNDAPEVQIAKQAKIIDALMRRANRQKDVGPSAFRAFQSAIELQQQVAAQIRDLARAETELESARYERERTRRNLIEALSSMEEGFALFTSGQLDLCNDLFSGLAPDIASEIVPGLPIRQFFDLVSDSVHLVSSDRGLDDVAAALQEYPEDSTTASIVLELSADRWYQMSAQRTSRENVVLLLTEITAIVRQNRVEKETLIDRQADYLQAVFQNMRSGVCTFSETGTVLMNNARFREILDLPAAILAPGQSIRDLLKYLRDHKMVRREDLAKVDVWRRELTSRGWLRKRVGHGVDRVVEIHANRMPDAGFLVELKDLTLEARTKETLENRVMERTAELTRANAELVREYQEKAVVEEALLQAKERAEAAVSSKTRFLAAASHDLLQPINAAKLLISTLQGLTRDTELSHLVDRLNGAFGSAEQLLHSLLDISRLESAEPDTVTPTGLCLAALMEGIYADQSLVAEQKNVRLDVVPSSAFVRSDPIYLLRSVQNLVVNAIQYTEPGGRVLVGCRRKAGHIVLEVWDTGIGIAHKDQDRIFEEFTRADNVPAGSGMGLGLSVVDRACRLLGHTLSVRSKPGVGTVFRIQMERVEGEREEAEPAGLMKLSEDTALEHIVLVIENDRDALYAITQLLEQWGASVLPAHSREEAATFVRDMGIPPDIILADYQLDDGDTGVEVVSHIRAVTGAHVPAILITADRGEPVRRDALQNDVSVLTKPVKLSRLRPMIMWKIRRFQTGEDAPLAIPTKVGDDSKDAEHKVRVPGGHA
ncbi:MAG: ATP-binding protein [Pseudomonadota bacterium]